MCVCHWGIAKFAKVKFESIVGNFPGLFKAWHAFLNLNVHPPISSECAKVVLGNNFFMDDGQRKFHIFVPVYRYVVIIIKMYIVRNRASGVYTILLSRHLVLVRLAQDMVVTRGK